MAKSAPKILRQGDVLLVRLEKAPDTLPEFKRVPRDGARVVLAYGEVTGHAHAIAEDGVALFEQPFRGTEAPRLLEVPEGGAVLRHEEHAAIDLEPGVYEVRRQREYDPRERRFVAD